MAGNICATHQCQHGTVRKWRHCGDCLEERGMLTSSELILSEKNQHLQRRLDKHWLGVNGCTPNQQAHYLVNAEVKRKSRDRFMFDVLSPEALKQLLVNITQVNADISKVEKALEKFYPCITRV